ncbi:hypothetical protein [Sphingobium sp. CCH11-B1]|jgi:AcrR family transcriptional regulator|uniref:hypothetical protein n=1 Tax=Sphingobium sp. CCH11-B1 TaxID=1768781 RepID=UPI00082FDA4D|nr:hypothetical protein [Sphingobium sp. CCH11-B1]
MKRTFSTDLRDDLIAATVAAIAADGIEGLSLRVLSQSVGKSTSVVFQLFGGKDGLLRETAKAMLERDQQYHAELACGLQGLTLTDALLSECLLHYVRQRTLVNSARFWTEAVFKSRHLPGIEGLVAQWRAMRASFWTGVLEGSRYAGLGGVLGGYLTMEEAYASALKGRLDYDLLLRETVDGLLSGCAGRHDPTTTRGAAASLVEERAFANAADFAVAPPAKMEMLMEAAVDQIMRMGATGLSLKQLAASVNQPPSQIIYHFGDFAAFRRQAIWRALMHALPDYLDVSRDRDDGYSADWSRELGETMQGKGDDRPAGFYVNYSRTLGQTCLVAATDPAMREFVLQLRVIEGAGIYRASQSIWAPSVRLSRDTATGFALWIKGQAILNEASGSNSTDSASEILFAAAALHGA